METMVDETTANLHQLCQHLRVEQEPPAAGTINTSRRHHISSESPFAEPPSSASGGDAVADSDQDGSADGSEHHAHHSAFGSATMAHSVSLSAPQLQCVQSEEYGRNSLDGQGQQPKSSQICFDYTKGLCTRGDKCKYSHDLATIVHFNSKEKGICFDYLRNQCHRGLLCRFSHDLSNIAQQCSATEVFSNTQAGKGKTSAICYDFVKGVCQRGSDCRYSHDLSLIARTARGGQQTQKSGEICYDYLRGRCNRGTSCKYSHNISFLATPAFLSGALGSNGGGNGGGNNNGSSGGQRSGCDTPALPGNANNNNNGTSMGGACTTTSASGSLTSNIMVGMAGLNTSAQQRLASSLSADPLGMNSSTSPASLQAALTSSLSTSISPDLEGHPLNSALSQELPDHHEQSCGGGHQWNNHRHNGNMNANMNGNMNANMNGNMNGNMHASMAQGVAHVQALAAAAQQRQYAAAAAVQLSNYNHLQQAAHMVRAAHAAHMAQMMPNDRSGVSPAGMGAATGFAAVAAQQQALASSLAAAQQQVAARALLHHSESGAGNNQLHRAHSAPLGNLHLQGAGMADSINQLLANLGDNPQLLAETLSGLAAAAQAQVHAAVRVSAPGLATHGSMGMVPPGHSAPQPIPGRYEAGSGVPSPPLNSYNHHHDNSYPSGGHGHMLAPSASVPGPDHLSRNVQQLANSLNVATISPDLLPLLKEIWNK